jgi:type II secretory pathway component PulL
MIDHDWYVVASPQESEPPVWVVLTTAFFHEESLSRRGAAYRVAFLAVVLVLIVAALIAEYHR